MNLQAIELLTKDESSWVLIEDDQDIPPDGDVLISPSRLIELDRNRYGQIGLIIDFETEAKSLEGIANGDQVIAIHFSAFTCGKGFTHARLLRERYKYMGKLIACGDFLPDQIHYLARCGFNSFILPDSENLETARSCLQAFSEAYQTSWDRKEPLFRRV